MKTMWRPYLAMLMVVLCAVGVATWHDSTTRDGLAEAQVIAPEVMEMKLTLSQELLKHLALKDFDAISRTANKLAELTEDAKWTRSRSSRYDMFAEDFLFRVTQLEDAADSGNIQGVTLHYTNLVRTCVECHEMVRDGHVLALNLN